MERPLFIDDLYLTGVVVQQVLRQTNHPGHHSACSNDSDAPNDYSPSGPLGAERLARPHRLAAGSEFRVLDWSELYNYRWPQFIKALAQPDDSFNGVFFINDLDRMPNRAELVELAWRKIRAYYQHSVT